MSLLLPTLDHCVLTKWLLSSVTVFASLFWSFPSFLSPSSPIPFYHPPHILLIFILHSLFFFFFFTPLFVFLYRWLFLYPSLPLSLPVVCCPSSCVNSRLALDDAIRHRQLNISRFSPRVAGENDFLQSVINKVISAKEVNHKGQGKTHLQHKQSYIQLTYTLVPHTKRGFRHLIERFISWRFFLKCWQVKCSDAREVLFPSFLLFISSPLFNFCSPVKFKLVMSMQSLEMSLQPHEKCTAGSRRPSWLKNLLIRECSQVFLGNVRTTGRKNKTTHTNQSNTASVVDPRFERNSPLYLDLHRIQCGTRVQYLISIHCLMIRIHRFNFSKSSFCSSKKVI